MTSLEQCERAKINPEQHEEIRAQTSRFVTSPTNIEYTIKFCFHNSN